MNRYFFIGLIFLTACAPTTNLINPSEPVAVEISATPTLSYSAVPTRPSYSPGELVDYLAQSGDTLPALAARFNSSESEIRAANPIIPEHVSTLPPGLPMKMPIYYETLWGSSYQIIPDSLFINGPAQVDFDIQDYLNQYDGWMKNYSEQIPAGPQSAANIIRVVATNFSLSPRLLLALVEYQSGGVTEPEKPNHNYYLGYQNRSYKGLYLQLVWAANTLNNGYYAQRRGALHQFELTDGSIQRPDPWQNAASIGIHYFYAKLNAKPEFDQLVSPDGFAFTYRSLFGDPWDTPAHIAGSIQQPEFNLPFERGVYWNLTGGPHTGWGNGEPLAALDFAPAGVSNCNASADWVTAVADGLVIRTGVGELILDLDMDGHEETGWVIFYLHVGNEGRAKVGQTLKQGDKVAHPSCEGGSSTGTHVHIARKYNGEWVLADSPIAFNFEGWQAQNGPEPYLGKLIRFSQTVEASVSAEGKSLISSGR